MKKAAIRNEKKIQNCLGAVLVKTEFPVASKLKNGEKTSICEKNRDPLFEIFKKVLTNSLLMAADTAPRPASPSSSTFPN